MFSRSRIASNNRAASGRADTAGAVVPTAPCPCSRGFRPRPSGRAPGIPARPSASSRTIEPSACRPALHVRPFAARFRQATMASADPCRPIPTPRSAGSTPDTTGADRQVSQGKTRDLRPTYPPHIRPDPPGDIGLRVSVPPRPGSGRLLCGSCSSGQDFAYSCLQTPSRDDALAVRLTVPVTRARRGLPPPSRPSRHHSETTSAVMALRAMPGASGRRGPCGAPPPTPPCVRFRTRRFMERNSGGGARPAG